MKNVIDVNAKIRVFLASELGTLIGQGMFQQVGVLRTEYVRVDAAPTGDGEVTTVLGRQVEAVILDKHLGKLYAVEQYKGLAIRAEICDEEMLAEMRATIPTLEDGEGFTYDQRVTLGQEELGSDYVRVPKGVEAVDGGLDA